MDGVHDMGGMHGFGAIVTQEPEGQGFDEPWHGRMFALTRLLRAVLPYGGDQTRQKIERSDPAWYLKQGDSADGYYAKWFAGHFAMLKELGVATDAELAGAPVQPLPAAFADRRCLDREAALAFVLGGSSSPSETRTPRFGVGETVRAARYGHSGHTRLPRFARGSLGRIERCHGVFPLADAVAAGAPRSEPVYAVSFASSDLWGSEAMPFDRVVVDLWESYLEAS